MARTRISIPRLREFWPFWEFVRVSFQLFFRFCTSIHQESSQKHSHLSLFTQRKLHAGALWFRFLSEKVSEKEIEIYRLQKHCIFGLVFSFWVQCTLSLVWVLMFLVGAHQTQTTVGHSRGGSEYFRQWVLHQMLICWAEFTRNITRVFPVLSLTYFWLQFLCVPVSCVWGR